MSHDWTDYCVRHVEGARTSPWRRRQFRRLLGDRWEEFTRAHGLPVTDPPDARFEPFYAASAPSPASRPGNGPGTHLKALLASLGFTKVGCVPCNDRAAAMDRGGLEWVQARREEIKVWLKANYKEQPWTSVLIAAGKAVVSGVAFRINPLDVFGSLIDECIRRAKEAQT